MFWGFDAGDDAAAVQDSLSRLLAGQYSFRQRSRILQSGPQADTVIWQAFGSLGLLGLGLPAPYGAMATTDAVGAAFVAANLAGRALLLEPLMQATLMSNTLLAQHCDERQRGLLMPGIADGSLFVLLAHAMTNAPRPDFTARFHDGAYLLQGACEDVPAGADAHWLIAPARVKDEAGLSLFLVRAGTQGLQVEARRNEAGMPVARVSLQDVALAPRARLGSGDSTASLQGALTLGLAASCVEALGAIDAVLGHTAQYLKLRKQFGVAIGSFQALRHRLVDMHTQAELARSLAWMAAACASGQSNLDDTARQRLLHSAKAQCSQACRVVGEGAVQLHGGIGMTDESEVSHYFRRLFEIARRFGGHSHHMAKLAAQAEVRGIHC